MISAMAVLKNGRYIVGYLDELTAIFPTKKPPVILLRKRTYG
jgi:hypothetical protein